MLSVIVPVYNSEKTIKKSLKSIFDSSYKDFEVIVVDDGSTDNSINVAKEFHIREFGLDKNSGAAVARNMGAKMANGKVLMFIDSDIIVKKDTISRFIAAFESTDADAIVATYDKPEIGANLATSYKGLFLYYMHDDLAARFWSGCGAVKRTVFEKLNGFNESMPGIVGEDTEFGYRMLDLGYKLHIDTDNKVFHLHEYSILSLIKNDFKRSKAWTKMLSKRRLEQSDYYIRKLKNPFSFYKFLFDERDFLFLLKVIPLNFMGYCAISLGYLVGKIENCGW